jgi:hypothetical protein
MRTKFQDDRKDTSWVMPKAKRLEWLMSYFTNPNRPYHHYKNALDQDFVDEYCENTNAPHMVRIIGANTCPTLSRDLHTLHKAGKLERIAGGVGDCRQYGFPSWVWLYRINKDA